MSSYLDICDQLKLNQYEVINISRIIKSKEIEAVVKCLSNKNHTQAQMDSMLNSARHLRQK